MIHSQWEGTEPVFKPSAASDGMLCISASERRTHRGPPSSIGRRTHCSASRPGGSPPASALPWGPAPQELVVGYCGRIRHQQKRVERIPEIASALRRAGVPHRWDSSGMAPTAFVWRRPWLQPEPTPAFMVRSAATLIGRCSPPGMSSSSPAIMKVFPSPCWRR